MPSTLFWRLAGTAALVAAGATLFWMTSQSPYKVAEAPPPTETSLSFAVVFDQSHALTQAAPKVMLEPLSGEMELLDHDFRAAVTFLADSMP